MAAFNASYLLPYSVYHPIAAYHRWFTVGLILPVILHFTQFLLRFPECDHPRLTRAILYVQWAIHLAICGIFIYVSSQTGVVFNTTGHYFDLDADSISTVQSAFIISYIVFSVIVALWRFFIRGGVQRWALLAIELILVFVMMVPAVLNTLSTRGRYFFAKAMPIFSKRPSFTANSVLSRAKKNTRGRYCAMIRPSTLIPSSCARAMYCWWDRTAATT